MHASKRVGGLLAVGFVCVSLTVAWSGIELGEEISRIGLADSHAATVQAQALEFHAGARGMRDSANQLAQASGQAQPPQPALGRYLSLVDYKISTNWLPTEPKAKTEAKVVIRFRVMRSGEVRDIGVETSSGDTILDQLALEAIQKSAPFPPFPNLLTEPFLDLLYSFVVERG